MTHALLIHNSCFRCKINKFISFFSKKRWKTCEKLKNNDVDIPHRYLDYRISTFFSLRFPQGYPHFLFQFFFHFLIELVTPKIFLCFFGSNTAEE